MGQFHKIRDSILDIFFPPICINCKSYTESKNDKGKLMCTECFGKIPIYENVFFKNGLTIASVSGYENESVRNLIHYFKYEGFLELEKTIDKLVKIYLQKSPINNIAGNNAVIIPIPIHKTRLRKRGFNQSETIAHVLGKYLALPVKTGILMKTSMTEQQIKLKDGVERRRNVKGSFSISDAGREIIKNTSVVLVDDVYTSGATAEEAKRTLLRAGAKKINVFVLAKGR